MQASVAYDGKAVRGMYLHSDINSPDDPEQMRRSPNYYLLPNMPWTTLSASLLRDLIDAIFFVDWRVGDPQFSIYLELEGEEKLVKMQNYELFKDI